MHKRIVELFVEKIAYSGAGQALFNNKTYHVVAALPGEIVRAEIVKKKANYLECVCQEVIQANPIRQSPRESHFISCSPWQIIPYDYQIRYKKEIVKNLFKNLTGVEIDVDIQKSEIEWNYRNKMEYSFTLVDQEIFLAFHQRGRYNQLIKLDDNNCALASEHINKTVSNLVNLIRSLKIPFEILKSLVVRYSNYQGKTLTLLLLKKSDNLSSLFTDSVLIDHYNNEDNNALLIGLSDSSSPVSRLDKLLYASHENFLVEKILDKYFVYTIDSFFQSNLRMYSKVIEIIKNLLPPKMKILELYGGVGTIGLSLANEAEFVYIVESNKSATISAEFNALINNIFNCRVICALAEDILDDALLNNIDVIVLNPPRSGLHKKVKKKIVKSNVSQIIYLSCNPLTQAIDFNDIKEYYNIKYVKAFDFYPQTPHVENLLVLERKR